MEDDASARIESALARVTGLSDSELGIMKGVHVIVEEGYEGYVNAIILRVWSSRLVELPPEIGMLHRLVQLDLMRCANLQRLPPEIGRLTKLEVLKLGECSDLVTLPEEIGRLTSLKELRLDCCFKLERLPRSLHQLSRLELLKLSYCKSLKGLPNDIFCLRSLKRVMLSFCQTLTRLPAGMGQLHQLEVLHLSGCNSLFEFPVEIGQLSNLKTLRLHALSQHTLQQCLQRIGTSSLLNLTILDLRDTLDLEELPHEMASLRNLEGLDLRHCKQLTQISKEVLSLPSLKRLKLGGCNALTISPAEIGKASYSLESVQMPTSASQDEMDCYCKMNKAGRHLLRRENGVPDALWPHVLAGRRSDENFMFWFLKHNPNFVKNRVEQRGTKRAREE